MQRASAAAEAQHVGRHFDGTPSHSRTRVMVMHSNVMVCWRDLRQICRDEQCIRMASCAGVVSGNLISSGSRHSNAKVCWPGLVNDIACGQAIGRLRVPGDLRQGDRVLPAHHCIGPAAQPARAVDAATRPQDRCDFEIWICSEAHLTLSVRRG
jgi:hypothetical protein